MNSKLITARFDGRCRNCSKSVKTGEPVYFAKHYGVRCRNCGPHLASDKPLPPKKGSKRFEREHVEVVEPRDPKTTRISKSGPVFTEQARTMVPDYTPADPRTRLTAQAGPDSVHRLMFESISDVLEASTGDYAVGSDAAGNAKMLNASLDSHAHSSWANGYTRETLPQALSQPKSELIEAISEMREHLVDDLALPATPRRRVRRGLDWGDDLDADRVLARDPQCWSRMTRESVPTRTVTIGVNLTVAWHQKPEELLYRGAAACALADVLQSRGLNVRILGISVGGQCSSVARKAVTMVQLKASDMPLDTAALATALCDIGFYRMGVLFAEGRHLPGTVSRNLGYRGVDQYLPGPDRAGLDYLVEHRVTDRDTATEWLRAQLATEQMVEA